MTRTRRSKRSRKGPTISDAGDESTGTGHGTETLTLGMEASDAEEGGPKTGHVTDQEIEQMMAELLKCRPGCTCMYCRPDLDLERLRDEGLIEHHDGKDYVRYRKQVLQVFNVKFIDFVGSGGRVRGNMRIPVIYGDYWLFGPDNDGLPYIEIDPSGNAELADADCSLDVADSLEIFLKLQTRADEKPSCQMKIKDCVNPLWNSFTEPIHKCLCKRLDTELGPVEVTFAIIWDAVQAHVEVCLLDWPLEKDTALVNGTISVGNTGIGNKNALTCLFQKTPKASVLVKRPLEEGSGVLLPCLFQKAPEGSVLVKRPLGEGAGVLLPFSKHYTYVPRDSALQVCVKLRSRFKKGFRWIARTVLEFSVKPGEYEQQIIEGNYFKLGVNVTWSPNELTSFEERTKRAVMRKLSLC